MMIKIEFCKINQLKKIIDIIIALNSNIIYSLKKRKAKLALPNSVLKPETNSDSASAKSNGARWVSPKLQIPQKGNKIKKNKLEELDILLKEVELDKKKKIIIIVDKTAS